MKLLIISLLFLPFVGLSQISGGDFPRDTSFNIHDTYLKERKYYPFIEPVKAFNIKGVQEKRDVVYYSFGKRKLHADVFYPSDKSETYPGVILIHGGGWASGDKSHLVPLAQKLAEHGYVATCVEYRLSPEALYPAAVIDLKTAVKWLKINASGFGCDSSLIAVLGTSAGATLASLLATTGGKAVYPSHKAEGNAGDRVQALVNIDGVPDFTTPSESAKDEDPAKPSAGARWFGATYKQKPELWKEASAVNYVDAETPATIFINSKNARFHAGRGDFLKVLDSYGTYNEVHNIPKTPHPFWLFYPWFDETWPKVVNFLDYVFKEE
ncbi:alpha/beta hydrolase [Maribellus sediminis]|uniref:alpha/beta hydrolase n=1 Tax=Maribellus sediminis TaxID=2696285 RepID=UPI00142F796E|nr:alpha/beta hydrolase [Maribellus sediminis]